MQESKSTNRTGKLGPAVLFFIIASGMTWTWLLPRLKAQAKVKTAAFVQDMGILAVCEGPAGKGPRLIHLVYRWIDPNGKNQSNDSYVNYSSSGCAQFAVGEAIKIRRAPNPPAAGSEWQSMPEIRWSEIQSGSASSF